MDVAFAVSIINPKIIPVGVSILVVMDVAFAEMKAVS